MISTDTERTGNYEENKEQKESLFLGINEDD